MNFSRIISRKLSMFVAAALMAILTAQAAQAISQLELYYDFNTGSGSTATDGSGNGRTGTLTNMDTVGDWVAGRTGQAGDFSLDFAGPNSGANDRVVATGYKGVTGTSPRSLTAWINSLAPDDTFMSWGANVNGDKWVFRTSDDNGANQALRVEVNGGFKSGTTDVVNTGWHLVTATWEDDGTPNVLDVRLYVDGVLEAAGPQLTNVIGTASNVDVLVGDDAFTNRNFFGQIDDAAIWGAALTSGEVKGMFDVSVAPSLLYDTGDFDLLKQIHDDGFGTVTIDGRIWEFASGLSGPAGLNGLNLVLDAQAGTGLHIVVPEPATATLGLLGLAGLMARRRRAA